MNVGYKLILIRLILSIAGFILSYEYPNMITGGSGEISAIGSLVIIVIVALFLFKSKSVRNIYQNCGQKLDKQEKYCPNCGNRI
jgi:hypothetical protein